MRRPYMSSSREVTSAGFDDLGGSLHKLMMLMPPAPRGTQPPLLSSRDITCALTCTRKSSLRTRTYHRTVTTFLYNSLANIGITVWNTVMFKLCSATSAVRHIKPRPMPNCRCCHLANLTARSPSHCTCILKASWWQL